MVGLCKKRRIYLLLLLFLTGNLYSEQEVAMQLLIDDFSKEVSPLGTRWEGFTDRVMGGVSNMTAGILQDGDETFVRMTGQVSLENNGGFIQIRLKLSNRGGTFDASPYKGVRLRIRGEGPRGYYLFLRTNKSLLPWQYYSAPIELTEDWQSVDIPWRDFQQGDYGSWGKMNPAKIKSLALVAYGQNFTAQVDLSSIGLY